MRRGPAGLLRCSFFGGVAALALAMAGCGTVAEVGEKLPFHLAIVPPVATGSAAALRQEGNPTEIALAVDETQLVRSLEQSLAGAFAKVSRLQPQAGTGEALVAQAQRQGADLILRTTLTYDPKIRTALNDRFWLNLPLFAIGGPFCWFVADRSYFCYSRLDGQLYDVSAAAKKGLEAPARVLRVERETKEAALNFLDRADGAGPYLLSLICPAGLIASESAAVPTQVDAAVVGDLCEAMAKALQDRATEITESDLADFHPRGVRVERDGGRRYLVGEMMLKLGQASELGTLRGRVGSGDFVEGSWGAASLVSPVGGDKGRKIYPFRIPLADAATGTMQVQVEQLDSALTSRTFTFPLEESAGR